MSAEDAKSQLEQRYIQLLEQRIADLEILVKKPADDSKDGSSKDKDSNAKPGEDDKDGKKKSRIRRVIAKVDQATGIRSDIDDDDERSKKKKGDFVLTFREVVQSSAEEKDGFCEVDIERGKLRDLLKDTVQEYPGQSWEGDIVNIATPFFPLVHNWKALEDAAKVVPEDDDDMKETRQDLNDLLEQIRTSPELTAYFKTRQSYLDAKITTYEAMWSLFVPGQLVYAKPFMKTPQLFTIDTAPYMWDSKHNPPRLNVSCWCYDWNGKEIVKAFYDIPIERFRGTKPVSELACYPLEYFKEDGAYTSEQQLRDMLIKRGIRYNQHVREKKGTRQMFEYYGEALAENRNTIGKDNTSDDMPPPDPGSPFFYEMMLSQRREREAKSKRKVMPLRGKYIVDCEAFLNYGGGSLAIGDCTPWQVEDRGVGDIKEVADQVKRKGLETDPKDLSEDERTYLLLLPPRFLGYSTHDKFWGQFSVDATDKVKKPSDDLFEKKLQLKSDYKKMISALVKNHASINEAPDASKKSVKDLVEGKGKGLVILLHGPPGVGKTLTAETIAEATGKPLFVVSVAEIGLNASKAEKNLEQMFSLAGTWEAVLLVDEADVFLESRTSEGDAERNALVSVLLRVLEYYHGIMILTTNRINSLDVAVQSRIHLAVRYDDLKKDQKKAIFTYYLDQLETSSIYNRDAIDEWIEEAGSEAELNGRQIRNIVSAALALARSDKGDGRVSKEHLKQVVRVSKEFATDLARTTKSARDQNEANRLR